MRKVLLLLLLLPVMVSGQVIETIAGNGTGGYAGDGHSCLLAELSSPDVIKFDHSGNMYIADEYNHVIRKINTSGIITTIAGTGTGGHTGDNGAATDAELKRPSDLAFDATGNLYITEYGNEDIRKISTDGIITTVAGTGIAGYNGDNILATAAQLNDPFGINFDSVGNIIFSENGNYRIRKIDILTGVITTIAGIGVAGYTGDNDQATTAEIFYPGYITFSPAGELYIPDYRNHVIRKIDHNGIITTIAGTGTSGYTGDNGPATAAELTSCFAILFDPAGNMYLSDRVLGVIRKINTAGIITTIAGIGTLGYGGDGGPATAAEFNQDVYCSAIDAYGNLYIADPLNNRIRRIVYDEAAVNNVNKATKNINIYPNPATNELTVKSADEIQGVEVINMIGQVVALQACKHKEVVVNVQALPAGVYFVKVNGPDGYRDGGRFLKE